ncbi:hypothetical protein SAY86_008080 [Trapa natans]|uniref:Transmembrane protein n=1 Tax=Trapa natans TaxID=22666 RepID=A0AAN7K9J4_TRANT|nr:hypothetical protein SAY86_008080 [Trapa natans]
MSISVLAPAAVAPEKLPLSSSSSDKQYALHGEIFMFVCILCFSLFLFFIVLLPFLRRLRNTAAASAYYEDSPPPPSAAPNVPMKDAEKG